jgi:hypothetical protein
LAIAVCAMALTGMAAASETRGFAVTWFQPAMYTGDDDCPDGLNTSPDFKAVFAAEGKTPDEIKALIDHPTSAEFAQAVINRGPHGENVCADPQAAPDPGHKIVQGKISFGFNLDGTADGAATASSCAHAKFSGPDGAAAIDNQLYRATGCMVALRGKRGHDGFVLSYIMERMRAEGMRTFLVEIAGLDAAKTEGDVQVGVYVGSDPLVLDAKGEVRRDTTQRISRDPRWRNLVAGHLKDGVITTDTFDLNLLGDPLWVPEFHFRRARMRLQVLANGDLKGEVGGYQDVATMYYNTVKSGILFETTNATSCPGVYNALKRLADGDPDPRTGQCTTISSDYAIEGIPAFVIHPEGEGKSKTAQAAFERRQD